MSAPQSRPPASSPSPAFEAAQQRISERRQQQQARIAADMAAARRRDDKLLGRLPGPLRGAGARGLAAVEGLARGMGLTGGSNVLGVAMPQGSDDVLPPFRVGQVDAELLDEELLELLRGQVNEGLRYLNDSSVASGADERAGGTRQLHVAPVRRLQDEYAAEIALLLRAALFKLSVWDHDATYGASLQGLRFSDARRRGPIPAPPSRWQKAAYGLATVVGPYVWVKWGEWLREREDATLLSEDEESQQESDDGVSRTGVRGTVSRWLRNTVTASSLSRLTEWATTAHAIAALVSFLAFLLHGRYRTLLDRMLRLRLVPASGRGQAARDVSFEYLNRQLVWHAFTEFLLFVLPLVGINRWRRWLARTWRRTKELAARPKNLDGADEKKGEFAFLPERTCAICYQDQNSTGATNEAELVMATAAAASGGGGIVGSAQTDVTNPYEAIPCGCVYCYVCLATRIEREEGDGFTCLRCGELVRECKPWNGDVLQEEEEEEFRRPARVTTSSSSKSVGFVEVGRNPTGERMSTSADDDDGIVMVNDDRVRRRQQVGYTGVDRSTLPRDNTEDSEVYGEGDLYED